MCHTWSWPRIRSPLGTLYFAPTDGPAMETPRSTYLKLRYKKLKEQLSINSIKLLNNKIESLQ
uniref:Uncharacterized protein n=1 Tax=Romanomermis culicivorax TaxID=13658 RepID=A0A915L0N5_ROMCU